MRSRIRNLAARTVEEQARDAAREVLAGMTENIFTATHHEELFNPHATRAYLDELGLRLQPVDGGFGFELVDLEGRKIWSSTQSAHEYITAMHCHIVRRVFKESPSLEELYARKNEREAEAILALDAPPAADELN